MIEMINALTGTEMCVAPDRKAEYLAAGHRLASKPTAKPAAGAEADHAAGKSSPAATKRKTTAKK